MTSPNNREGDMVARVYRIIRTGVNQEVRIIAMTSE